MAHNSTNSQLPEQKKTSRKPSASQKNGGGTPKTKQNAPKSKLKRKTVDRVNSNENVWTCNLRNLCYDKPFENNKYSLWQPILFSWKVR